MQWWILLEVKFMDCPRGCESLFLCASSRSLPFWCVMLPGHSCLQSLTGKGDVASGGELLCPFRSRLEGRLETRD